MDNIQPSTLPSAPTTILITPSSATESLATATVAVADDDEVKNESTSDNNNNNNQNCHHCIIGTLPYLSRIKAPVTQQQQQQQGEEEQQNVQRFAFVVAYDGTPFHGLAKDPKQPNTIQEYVENRLSAMLGGRPCNITLNGRTDAGVHSNGTVFHFDMTKEEIERFANYKKNSRRSQSEKEKIEKNQQHSSSSAAAATENASYTTARMFRNSLRRGLVGMEGRVEQLIQIRNVFPVNYHKFHARKSCIGKQYTYKIHEGYPLPLEARSCWAMNGNRLDIKKMDIVAQQTLVGIHDCSILVRDKRCRSDYRSPIRQIYKIQILRTEKKDNNNDDCNIDKQQQQQQQQHEITVAKTTSLDDDEDCDSSDSSFPSSSPKFGRIVIQIQADFFLRNMCRRIVGVLVQVGLGKCEPQEVHDNLFVEEQQQQQQQQAGDNNNNNNNRRKTINDARGKFIMTAPAKGLRLDYVLYDANGNGKDPTLPATTTAGTTTWANCNSTS